LHDSDNIFGIKQRKLDEEESLLVYGFNLCAKSGMSSIEIDFNILKSFAKKYGLDGFEVLGIYNKIISEMKD
jgi:hypothetical protein